MSILNHPADATERLALAVAHMQHAFSLIHSVDPGIVERLASGAVTLSTPPSLGLHRPETSIIDAGTFSVRWANRTCRLGNTVAFRLLARLARRPNHYLSYESLRDGIWDKCESDAAVQSAVKVLRRKLSAAAMADLAAVIDGSVSHHYALMLRDL
jgi:DNA-binding response OmpR family regulator